MVGGLSAICTNGRENSTCSIVLFVEAADLSGHATHPGKFCDFLFKCAASGRIKRAMVTDAPPRKKNGQFFAESDRLNTLRLPQDDRLRRIASAIETAMKMGRTKEVLRVSGEFLDAEADFYQVKHCEMRVLAVRPLRVRERSTIELFGDYNPNTILIRVWMKTAIRKEVTSFGTFLSTLCHEFCHHLDFQRFPNSWHTRGFYERTASLYHHVRGTPQKRLIWLPDRAIAGALTGNVRTACSIHIPPIDVPKRNAGLLMFRLRDFNHFPAVISLHEHPA